MKKSTNSIPSAWVQNILDFRVVLATMPRRKIKELIFKDRLVDEVILPDLGTLAFDWKHFG